MALSAHRVTRSSTSPPTERSCACVSALPMLAAFHGGENGADLLLCPHDILGATTHVDAAGDTDHGHVDERHAGSRPFGLVGRDCGEKHGGHLAHQQRVAGYHHRAAAVAVDDDGLAVGYVLDHVREQNARPQLVCRAGVQAGQDRPPRVLDLLEVGPVHLKDAELALDEQDARLDGRHRARRHLHDERVLALPWRVASRTRGRSHEGGELAPKIPHEQVHAQLRRWVCGRLRDRRRCLTSRPGSRLRWCLHLVRHPAYSPRTWKCLASSPCGRGMTCTDTSSPMLVAVSAPASVAAFTAPTSPMTVTDTRPSPTSSRPTIVTLAAFTMASAAASAATYPFVSIIPIALSATFPPSFRSNCSAWNIRSWSRFAGPSMAYGPPTFVGASPVEGSIDPRMSASMGGGWPANQAAATEPCATRTRSPTPLPSTSKATSR